MLFKHSNEHTQDTIIPFLPILERWNRVKSHSRAYSQNPSSGFPIVLGMTPTTRKALVGNS
jgi:hypothetical protein